MSNSYDEKVIGKVGSIDLVSVSKNDEYVTNKWGAKVYMQDPSRHDVLDIPKIDAESEGRTYRVCSLGMAQTTPIVTIMEGEKAVVYRLPIEYSEWVMTAMGMAHSGLNPFPCKVEFGYNIHQQRYYAEIL
jgi:hypothetical protein